MIFIGGGCNMSPLGSPVMVRVFRSMGDPSLEE